VSFSASHIVSIAIINHVFVIDMFRLGSCRYRVRCEGGGIQSGSSNDEY
jgi:hypothetical protein